MAKGQSYHPRFIQDVLNDSIPAELAYLLKPWQITKWRKNKPVFIGENFYNLNQKKSFKMEYLKMLAIIRMYKLRFQLSNPHKKLLVTKNNEKLILRQVYKSNRYLTLRLCCEYLGLSSRKYLALKKEKQIRECTPEVYFKCNKFKKHQLTTVEVFKIKNILEDPKHKSWPISRLHCFCTYTGCQNRYIRLTIKNVPYQTPFAWDNVTAISNIIPPPQPANCGPLNYFNFDITNSAGTRLENNTLMQQISNYEGEACGISFYNNCSVNNSVVQCGKYVGDVINPYVENIRGNWRVKKSYSYLTDRVQANTGALSMNGDVRGDGTYTTFLPFYQYTALSSKWEPIYTYNSASANPFDKWIKNNEVDKINEYGNVLQARDVLNRPSASLYGYNHTLPVAAANNAYYNQLAFDGFEDYAYIKNECSGSLQGTTSSTNPSGYIEHFNYYIYNSQLTTNQSHTGRYSIAVPASSALTVSRKLTNPNFVGGLDDKLYHIKDWDNAGLFGPYYTQVQKFVISAWTKESLLIRSTNTTPVLTYPNVGLSVALNGAYLTASPKKSAIINGWQKLEYEFTIPATAIPPTGFASIAVSLLNNGTNDVFYDDIRIHPFNSSMKSMVYDPQTLRLMAELDDRNYATFYEYDEEGTLVRVKKETEKGIYTIKESRSGLKK